MADGLQSLERDHRFIVLGEIAGEKENLLGSHR
jgi:hypothetical protein